MKLLPFANEQAAEIAGWPLNADEARAWFGHDAEFPLSPNKLISRSDEEHAYGFVAEDAGHLVAYGELWVDIDEREIELARLIVHPAHRGRGVGRAFVAALVHRAAAYQLSDLFMRVRPDNHCALRCYQSAGFAPVPKNEQESFNNRQPMDYVWLKYGG